MNLHNKKKMIRKIKYVLILLLTVIAYDSAAQNSQVLYYMNLPQNHFLNPALRPSNSVYIGLPALSGVNVNINNNFFNFSDIFTRSATGDSIISIFHPDYNVDEFIAKIKDINSIEPQGLVQLFGLGFYAGRDLYISFDINERVEGNVAFPGDLLKLGFEGNEQFVGDKIDLVSLRGDAKYYREAGLGFSKNITNRLRLGVRGKLLFGVAAASIDNRSLGITVNDDYSHTFDADLMVNISAPVTVYISDENTIDSLKFDDSGLETGNEIFRYLVKTGNTGLGLDIGAEMNITEKLKVSASITDLGYIKWERDITNLKAESQFEFSGVDFLDVYEGKMTFDSLAQELLDSLKNSFFLTDTQKPFTTNLPVGVSVGGSYNLTKSFSVGLLSYTKIIGKQFREAVTLSANLNLGNAFSTSVAYTAANYRYDNFGFGLAFRAGFFQFYALADRIPVTWNRLISDGNKIPLPESWNTIHARFGMNLVFGNKAKSKVDKPMVLVQQ
jgi:hypothetical protein